MQRTSPRTNGGITVFVLFFGIALLDAVSSKHWLSALFWLLMATAFAVLGARRWSSRHR